MTLSVTGLILTSSRARRKTKLFVLPGTNLGIFKGCKHKPKLVTGNTIIHRKEFILMNSKNNSSPLTFKALTSPAPLIFYNKPSIRYKFPKMDVVEPGGYFSEIKHMESLFTKKGESAFDVCYEVVNFMHYARYMLGLTNVEPKKFRVKERILRDSERENDLIESLCDFYDLEDRMTSDDLIGLTEVYNIGYFGDDDCIGTIHGRKGISEDALLAWYEDTYVSYDE